MQKWFVGVIAASAVVAALIFTQAFQERSGGREADRVVGPRPEGHPLLADASEVVRAVGLELADTTNEMQAAAIAAQGDRPADGLPPITVTYPFDGSVFPPDIVAPRILWTDAAPGVDTWRIEIDLGEGGRWVDALVPGSPPPQGEIDPACVAATNEPPPEPGAFDRSWTPSGALWDLLKQGSVNGWATLSLSGFAHDRPEQRRSFGRFRFRTSKDPVGAPIFYRDVPLVPAVTAEGVIKPLPKGAVPLIAWRLKDVSRHDSRAVLKGMPTCANCHSFSRDGATLGMDVDGPSGDKGTYMITPVRERMVVDYPDVITWNDFPDKLEGLNTLGFLSRISPTGRFVVTTVNESLYVANFTNYRFIQVFYPTRGILAWYDRTTKEMKALPGADDPEFVHCDPAWFPDDRSIVFARARAREPYRPDVPLAEAPNDPNEPVMKYDLCRMKFDQGRGGAPTPIKGASANGMSNTFPKVSPDGKWIVFTKCKNGQLLRPDGKLWIVPAEGGEAREMRCNTWRMNSWHSFSPSGRWMVFSSKAFTPYTQMFLTHIDEEGNDTPPILVRNATAANRAVNLPEFLNASYDDLLSIEVPAVKHKRFIDRGREHLAEGNIEEAEQMFKEAVALDPERARARVEWGNALRRLGRTTEAREQFERALEIDPGSHAACNNLGYLLYEMGPDHRAEAIRLYRKALELAPGYARARKNLGYALLELGDLDGARAAYERAAVDDATDASIHGTLSTILLRQGRPALAVRHLRQALALDTEDLEAAAALAWLLATSPDATLRDGREAVRLAERAAAVEGEGATPERLDVLAAAYAEAGRFEDALRTAEQAVETARATRNADAALLRALASRIDGYRAGRPHRSGTAAD